MTGTLYRGKMCSEAAEPSTTKPGSASSIQPPTRDLASVADSGGLTSAQT